MKTIYLPHLGKSVKLGRRPPRIRCPRRRLGDYLRYSLPAPPASCDYSVKGQPVLSDVYLNDTYGDCVIAAMYHLVGLWTGNAAGKAWLASASQIIADYSAIGGFDPNNPNITDHGCDVQTALNYWVQHGLADGTKLLGWLSVDATNAEEVMAAMYLFENLFFGVGLPDDWIAPAPSASDFVWAPAGAPDPENGHAFVGVGYDPSGVKIDTWGLIGTITYEAISEYGASPGGGELYVCLSPDQIAKGAIKAPNGVDWSSLIADFDAMGGHVPIPPPPPPPPHPPNPSPTLAQAEAWAAAGLARGSPVLTRAKAIALVNQGLTANWPKP
jgi:hypothetical protein